MFIKEKLKFIRKIISSYKRLKISKKVTLWTFLVVGLLAIGYLVFSLVYFEKIYPRVYIGQKNYSGYTKEALLADLNLRFEKIDQGTLNFDHEGKIYEIKVQDLDLSIDTNELANQAIQVGRPDSFLWGFYEQIKYLLIGKDISTGLKFDQQTLKDKFVAITDQIDSPAVNASARFESGSIVASQEKPGRRINQNKILTQISSDLTDLKLSNYTLVLEDDIPTVVLGEISVLENRVKELEKTSLTLTWDTTSRLLTPTEIRSLIGFVGDKGHNNPSVLTADFTKEKIFAYLVTLGESINQPAREPRLIIRDGKLAVVESSREGRSIDIELSTDKILAALASFEPTKTATLLFKKTAPVITEDRLDELGIKERIGYGETNFAGSPANRRHNIVTGVAIFQSALIAPGEEFSTVGHLGAVNAATGFLPELVIKDNRTIPEYGGGLCQVSTTLFRTALNAGLKITERRNHAYRVSYYEPPLGLDATIYIPKPDFRFLNDTSAHILVQGRVQRDRVIFEFWGTNDGRIASISNTEILSTSPAGEPIYTETDTLPRGEIKQIERPHDGATTLVHYSVIRNGQVINRQTFRSVYRAWPARFLVGTRDPAPPPTP